MASQDLNSRILRRPLFLGKGPGEGDNMSHLFRH
jgi:hypothetical protein